MRIDIDNEVTQPKLVTREITIKEATDGTGFKTFRVKVTYELINRDEALDLAREDNGDEALMARVLKGWGDPRRDGRGGFDDMNGNPLPFTPETLSKLMKKTNISTGLVQGYFDVARGGKLGN
jgi:hypothetical protein